MKHVIVMDKEEKCRFDCFDRERKKIKNLSLSLPNNKILA